MLRHRLVALFGMVVAASISNAQSTFQEQMDKRLAIIKHHAEEYYPAITGATHLPDGVVIGFILTPNLEVLGHSVAFDLQVGVSTTDELRKMFPAKKISGIGGGACFGGGKPNEPKYCVAWGELEK